GKERCSHDVVDAPAPIVLERIAEVIPVGILNPLGMKFPKNVHKAPTGRLRVGCAGVDMEVNIVDPAVRMIYVEGFRSDVHIARPDDRLLRIEPLVEILPNPPEPLQLERIFL